VTIQAQVLELIREIQRKRGMAVLLITHDMGVVAELADDVLVMYATQIVERGSIDQIFDKMGHPYTEGLFQSRPSYLKPQGELHSIKGTVPPYTHMPKGCHFNPRCPYVMERCRHGPVPDFPVQHEHSHQAKCWLHDPHLRPEERHK
jgi:oligopeptide/dipeptide ABC transporter ATP-binding protein